MTLESQQQQPEGQVLCPFFLSPEEEEEEEDLEARSVLGLVEVEEQCGSRGFLDSNVYIEDCRRRLFPLHCFRYCAGKFTNALVGRQSSWKHEWRQSAGKNAAGEKASDSLNNKWRKYRRAASFDSRKIVIVFSVMSSLGTLILIYLALRVKLNGDGYVHTS